MSTGELVKIAVAVALWSFAWSFVWSGVVFWVGYRFGRKHWS